MFNSFSNEEKEAIVFYIRSELFIDGFQITVDDLAEILNGSITTKKSLEKLLGLSDGWEPLFKQALDFKLESHDLEKLLDKDIKFSNWTIKCSNCDWKGTDEELETEIDLDELHAKPVDGKSKLYCPDCGKQIKLEVSEEKELTIPIDVPVKKKIKTKVNKK